MDKSIIFFKDFIIKSNYYQISGSECALLILSNQISVGRSVGSCNLRTRSSYLKLGEPTQKSTQQIETIKQNFYTIM